jgi:hypothetical protein
MEIFAKLNIDSLALTTPVKSFTRLNPGADESSIIKLENEAIDLEV